jgi:hypothetical protein
MPDHSSRPVPAWVQVADLLTLLVAAFAAWMAIGGGLDVRVSGMRLSARSATRVLVVLGMLLAARHVAFPSPSIVTRIWRGLLAGGRGARRARPREALARWCMAARARWPLLTEALPVWAVTRLGVLGAGLVGLAFLGYAPNQPQWRISTDELLNLPARWDAGWYISIAMVGYERAPDWSGQSNLAFFPAYPLLMWLAGLGQLGEPEVLLVTWVGVGVSMAAFLWALVYVSRMAREFGSDDDARAAAWLLASYPCAVYFSAAYTESLYLLGATAAFFHAWRNQPGRASAWALLVGLTRPNGMFLGLPLAVLALQRLSRELGDRDARRPTPGRILARLAPAAAPALGAVVFFAYLWSLTGHPWAWREAQVAGWAREYEGLGGLFWYALTQVWELGPVDYLMKSPIDALDLSATLFMLGAIWPVTKRLGLAAGALVAINTLVPVLFGGLISMGRFTSVLFPVFIWLAVSLRPRTRWAMTVLFAMGQGLGAAAHFTWRPFF